MRVARWLPALAWMAVIYRLSAQPGLPIEPPLPDYVLHFSTYAVLAALLHRAAGPTGRSGLLIAIAVSSIYGITDEIHQAYVPGRDPAVSDWIADTLGAAAACWLLDRFRSWLDLRRGLLLTGAVAVFALVPAIVLLRQSSPAFTGTALVALAVAVPIAIAAGVRRAGMGAAHVLALLAIMVVIQGLMRVAGLTVQESLHLYEYGALGLLFVADLRDRRRTTGTLAGATAFVLALALADEFLQWLWPHRVGEIKDVGEDVLFGLLGAASLALITGARSQVLSRRAVHGLLAVLPCVLLFILAVHAGEARTAAQLRYITAVHLGRLWPPTTVLRKEALAHIAHRNALYEAGRTAEAAAENAILESGYGHFMEGYRYPPQQRPGLPSPPSGYLSPVPSLLYFTW